MAERRKESPEREREESARRGRMGTMQRGRGFVRGPWLESNGARECVEEGSDADSGIGS